MTDSVSGASLHTLKAMGETTAQFHAKVLFEELFYNKKFQSFRVLCIDRILNEPFANNTAGSGDTDKFNVPRVCATGHCTDLFFTLLISRRI